jgi:hypothetical protein
MRFPCYLVARVLAEPLENLLTTSIHFLKGISFSYEDNNMLCFTEYNGWYTYSISKKYKVCSQDNYTKKSRQMLTVYLPHIYWIKLKFIHNCTYSSLASSKYHKCQAKGVKTKRHATGVACHIWLLYWQYYKYTIFLSTWLVEIRIYEVFFVTQPIIKIINIKTKPWKLSAITWLISDGSKVLKSWLSLNDHSLIQSHACCTRSIQATGNTN